MYVASHPPGNLRPAQLSLEPPPPPSTTPGNDYFDLQVDIRGPFPSENMTYPLPETFAARGPYQSTINYRYLKQYGSLPGAELALELLQRYWEGVPGDASGSNLPDGGRIGDLHRDQDSRHPIVRQKPFRGVRVDALDGALQFHQACLALVPFLGPSPAEVYGGPLRRRAPTPLPSPGHSQQQIDQTTTDASASHSPINSE